MHGKVQKSTQGRARDRNLGEETKSVKDQIALFPASEQKGDKTVVEATGIPAGETKSRAVACDDADGNDEGKRLSVKDLVELFTVNPEDELPQEKLRQPA